MDARTSPGVDDAGAGALTSVPVEEATAGALTSASPSADAGVHACDSFGLGVSTTGQSFSRAHVRACVPSPPHADQSVQVQSSCAQVAAGVHACDSGGFCVETPGQSVLSAQVLDCVFFAASHAPHAPQDQSSLVHAGA